MNAPKQVVEGRIVGGCSMHGAYNPALCERHGGPNCGEPRVVDCCSVEPDRDILECSKCGKQWSAPCSFDDDYS
jgi:hypothetical protein